MKKMLAVGATAALMLAASSPAFAQDALAIDDSVATGGNVLVVDASQFQGASVSQVNTGDTFAFADNGSAAAASIDQSTTVEQSQVNGGFGWFYFVY